MPDICQSCRKPAPVLFAETRKTQARALQWPAREWNWDDERFKLCLTCKWDLDTLREAELQLDSLACRGWKSRKIKKRRRVVDTFYDPSQAIGWRWGSFHPVPFWAMEEV